MADEIYIKELCGDFLGAEWNQFPKTIQIECLRRGFAHKTYRCSLDINGEDKSVIMKIFNSEYTSQYSRYAFHGMTAEMVVFSLLSSAGIAPKLLATFDEGRIEEYIEGRSLENEDFDREPSLYSTIAKLLVKFHRQSMPITKRLNYFGKLINELTISNANSVEEYYKKEWIHFKSIREFPLENELEWIIRNVDKINSKVVFSHNNLYPGNLLLKEKFNSEDDRLVLIDYEVSGYNYRGYDLGFLLNNSRYRFSELDNEIQIEFEGETKPENERLFIEEYLKELERTEQLNQDLDSVDHLLMECRFFSLLAQLALICFGKGLIKTPKWSHKMTTFSILTVWTTNYKKMKERFCSSYSHVVN